ncbi:FAD-binding oxidoreductase [Lusitaniella coriacea LEGE 07157]|uniref:FAD-binding oxidoreductase n=1 Tax=Lusitaniella coriacea LEGE 07157 TaxID=945747 RepID=A0A8J7DW05_9CYAN|nr:FAD-binding oxidoreductase [Lusitaniella coriacea]MBE9116169.1 FAD-binding oxidoreductase [Lusitaniella coriacea LEGE 07157]
MNVRYQTPLSAIASTLTNSINSNLNLRSWLELEPEWQEKIQAAFATTEIPIHWVAPETPDTLSALLQQANCNSWQVLICGNGSKLSWGGLPQQPIPLIIGTQRLNRIIEHAVDDLTVTVEAGVKLADLQRTLNQKGQFVPLHPAYPKASTIGGIVATADTWRQRYGGVRDLILGLSFARADGQIAKAGGRVVKNVAGYDLMKLFAGSYGTLGAISQIALRTYPLPEASETVLLLGTPDDIEKGVRTLNASGLTPYRADLLSPAAIKQLGLGSGMGLLVCFQSIAESVKAQSTQMESLGQQLALQTTCYRTEAEITLWQELQQLLCVPTSEAAITCKMGIIPTEAISFLRDFDQLTGGQGLGVIHGSTGLGRLQLNGDEGLGQVKTLRSRCEENRGFLTLLEAAISLKKQFDPWGYSGNALGIMKKIKTKFDPNNILSPGRFAGGI